MRSLGLVPPFSLRIGMRFYRLKLTCIVDSFSLFSLWIIVTTEPIRICLDRFLSVTLLYLVQSSPVMIQILKLLNLS